MYDVELSDIRRKLVDLTRQLDNLARREYTPFALPADVTRTSGTPTAGRLAQWTGAGTIEQTTYAGSSVLRYSGVPSAGNFTYFTANGTVADSGLSTAVLTTTVKYSGVPSAGRYAYWTGNGTVADSGFGTADLPRYSGAPSGSAITYWTGNGTIAHGSVTYSHTSGTPVLAPSGSHALRIHDASGNMAFNIANNGVVSSDKGLYITQLASTGNALNVSRSLASGQTDSPVAYINNSSATDDQPALRVNQAGTANIVEIQDGGASVFVIGDGGDVTLAGDDSSGIQLIIAPTGTNTRAMIRMYPQGAPAANNGRAIQQFFNTDFGADPSNYEYAEFGFIDDMMVVFSGKAGAGTVRPVSLRTSGNDNQLFLHTNGSNGMGVSLPLGKLHIDQANTSGTIPTLLLEQRDLSEEFIEFATTVGAGNPIDTAAVGTFYGKVRVNVTSVGYKYIPLYNS